MLINEKSTQISEEGNKLIIAYNAQRVQNAPYFSRTKIFSYELTFHHYSLRFCFWLLLRLISYGNTYTLGLSIISDCTG